MLEIAGGIIIAYFGLQLIGLIFLLLTEGGGDNY